MFVSLILFAVVCTPYAVSQFCPEPDICTCKDEVLSCICKDEETSISLNAFDESIMNIYIEGCRSVNVSMGFINFKDLNSVQFVNVDTLIFRKFSLMESQIKSEFRLKNISNLHVMKFGFNSLHVDTLILENVFVDEVVEFAFTGVNISQQLRITDSNFRTVKNEGFVFNSVPSILITNSSFPDMQPMSFVVQDSGKVHFIRTVFNELHNSTFAVRSTGTLVVEDCSFNIIPYGAFATGHLGYFRFENNYIMDLRSDAFILVNVTDLFRFSDNVIETAEEDSAPPSKLMFAAIQRKEVGYVCNDNSFLCDCQLEWMWESSGRYDTLRESSTCVGLPGVNLTSVVYLDSENNCVETYNDTVTGDNLSGAGTPVFSEKLFVVILLLLFQRT